MGLLLQRESYTLLPNVLTEMRHLKIILGRKQRTQNNFRKGDSGRFLFYFFEIVYACIWVMDTHSISLVYKTLK